MAMSSKRVCLQPGCNVLVRGAPRCPAHARVDMRSGSYSQRVGIDRSAWSRARNAYLVENPYCVSHLFAKQHIQATIVDHVTPHRGNLDLFWDEKNWQALCKSCHDRKTAMFDSSFIQDRSQTR
jgi:5-methylcytosine-specific restriction enzyme A